MNKKKSNTIEKKYKDLKIGKSNLTYDQICFPKCFKIQKYQIFPSQYINPKTKNNSLLIYHGIGSGKSCTAFQVAKVWSKVNYTVYIVLPAFLINNFKSELLTPCAEYMFISKEDSEKMHNLNIDSKKYKQIINDANNKINKKYKIISYNKFFDKLEQNKIPSKNTLIILDEIHNLISYSGKYYLLLNNFILLNKNNDTLKIVFMSATPIYDKPDELAILLNLLNRDNKLPIQTDFYKMFIIQKNDKYYINPDNKHLLTDSINNKVSYFKGPPDFVYPKQKFYIVNCPMSNFQYKAYKKIYQKEIHNRKKNIDYEKITNLPINFYIGTRIISNIAYPNNYINEKGLRSITKKNSNMADIKEYSIKVYKILKKIKDAKGPVFIYSNFKGYGGIYMLSHILTLKGYKNFKQHGIGKKRYAIWSGDESDTYKNKIKQIFNSVNNKNGKYIQIILGSPSIKEGISLFNINQIHILEPYWNKSRFIQIIGRAFRYCSHKYLPKNKRYVDIYLYLTTTKNKKIESVDKYIYDLANKKSKITSIFDKLLKEYAVDCKLFSNPNNIICKK